MTEYYQIPVKYIHSSVPESEFSSNEINDLALAIINAGCLLEPLIVKQINFQSYELISDHRNYYAALKAKELNVHVAEMVSVFVIPDENYEDVLKQIELLSKANKLLPPDSQQSLQILNAIHKLQSQTSEVLKRIEQVEGNVQATIAKVPVTTQTPVPNPELVQNLISELFSNLSNGSVEVVIRKPNEVRTIDLSSLTLEQVKEACLARSIVPMDLSELKELYSDLSIKGLNKKLKDYHIDLVVTSANKPACVKKLLEYHESQANQSRQRSENSSSTKKDSKDSVTSPSSKVSTLGSTSSKKSSAKSNSLITSYDAFVEESMKTLKKLNIDYNYDNLVPIYVLRRTLGDRVDRTQFNEWILQMHAQSVVELMSGNMPDLTPDIVEDSVVNEFGSVYYSAALD